MKRFSYFLRYIGFFVLVLGVVSCSEKSQVVKSKPAITEGLGYAPTKAKAELLSVYKSPTCGCCGGWIEHVEAAGFDTTVYHPADLNQIKADNGILPDYQSCHTSISKDGYVFEGHIPAKYIQQFLLNPPPGAIGLAVPAMPIGSPGMEMDDRFSPYQVLLINRDGSSEVFAQVGVQENQY